MTVSAPKPPVLSRRPVVEDYQNDYRKEALRKGKCLSIGIQVLTGRRMITIKTDKRPKNRYSTQFGEEKWFYV